MNIGQLKILNLYNLQNCRFSIATFMFKKNSFVDRKINNNNWIFDWCFELSIILGGWLKPTIIIYLVCVVISCKRRRESWLIYFYLETSCSTNWRSKKKQSTFVQLSFTVRDLPQNNLLSRAEQLSESPSERKVNSNNFIEIQQRIA